MQAELKHNTFMEERKESRQQRQQHSSPQTIRALFSQLGIEPENTRVFEEQQIDMSSLHMMSDDDVDIFLPLYGPRLKLKKYLKEMRNSASSVYEVERKEPNSHPPQQISISNHPTTFQSPSPRLPPSPASSPNSSHINSQISDYPQPSPIIAPQGGRQAYRNIEYATGQQRQLAAPNAREASNRAKFPLLYTRRSSPVAPAAMSLSPTDGYSSSSMKSKVILPGGSGVRGSTFFVTKQNRLIMTDAVNKGHYIKQKEMLDQLKKDFDDQELVPSTQFQFIGGKFPKRKVSEDCVARFLQYSCLRKFFRQYVSAKGKSQYILFWKACRKYQQLQDSEAPRHVTANEIIKTYIEHGSKKYISLESSTIQTILKARNKPYKSLFDKAQNEIISMIVPLFCDFTHSRLFHEYGQEVDRVLKAPESEEMKQNSFYPQSMDHIGQHMAGNHQVSASELQLDQALHWNSVQVVAWLHNLDLGEGRADYERSFSTTGINGRELLAISESSLSELVPEPIYRTRILGAVSFLKSKMRATVTQVFISNDQLSDITKIGEGHYGLAYRAQWNSPGSPPQIVVVKVSKKSPDGTEWNELIALKNIRPHNNFLPCFGLMLDFQPPTDENSDKPIRISAAIVVPWINSGNLKEFIYRRNEAPDRKPLEHDVALQFASDMAKSIEHMHSEGYVHRDVAARNFLLQKDMNGLINVVISDFGMSRRIDDEVENAEAIPWLFCSPEMLQQSTISKTESDVWMFGIALWQLICAGTGVEPEPFLGHPAVANDDHEELLLEFDVTRSEPIPLTWPKKDDFLPVFQDMVQDCCQFNLEDRPTMYHLVTQITKFINNRDASYVTWREKAVKRERIRAGQSNILEHRRVGSASYKKSLADGIPRPEFDKNASQAARQSQTSPRGYYVDVSPVAADPNKEEKQEFSPKNDLSKSITTPPSPHSPHSPSNSSSGVSSQSQEPHSQEPHSDHRSSASSSSSSLSSSSASSSSSLRVRKAYHSRTKSTPVFTAKYKEIIPSDIKHPLNKANSSPSPAVTNAPSSHKEEPINVNMFPPTEQQDEIPRRKEPRGDRQSPKRIHSHPVVHHFTIGDQDHMYKYPQTAEIRQQQKSPRKALYRGQRPPESQPQPHHTQPHHTQPHHTQPHPGSTNNGQQRRQPIAIKTAYQQPQRQMISAQSHHLKTPLDMPSSKHFQGHQRAVSSPPVMTDIDLNDGRNEGGKKKKPKKLGQFRKWMKERTKKKKPKD